MPLPTSYTDTTLAEFMAALIGDIATDLGFTDTTNGGDYAIEVNTVLRQMGYVTVEAVPEDRIGELELRARIQAWGKAVAGYVRAYSIGGLQRTLARDQLFQHARIMYADAQAQLAAETLATQPDTTFGGGTYSGSVRIRVRPPIG